jgi:RNA polymerase-binding transcription factor DksA
MASVMRSDTHPAIRRLHERRWAIMSRYRVWDDDWVHDLTDEDARQLLGIFEAIRRVDLGTYGLCASCGSVVDRDRLARVPEAAMCEVCAEFAYGGVSAHAAVM